MFISGLLLVQAVPLLAQPPPALSPQSAPAGGTGAERLLEEARAVWSKALFDDDMDAAQNQCREALRLFRQSGDLAGAARALDELGLIALKRRRISEALSLFDQALKAARVVSDQTREALAREHLGRAYAAANQRQEAVNADQQALALYRQNKQPRGESRTLIHLGRLHQESGRTGLAIGQYQQALAAASRIKDGGLLAEALDHLTKTYTRLGDTHQALRYAARSLDAHRQIDDQLGEGDALTNLAEIHREMGQVEQAIGFYQRASTLASQIKATTRQWKLHARLARAYQDQGQTDPARSAYESSIKIIEATPAQMMAEPSDEAISIDEQEVFRDYIDFLLGSDHTSSEVERALAVSEQARARGFLKLLAEARIQPRQDVDTLLLERERGLLQKRHDLQIALQAPGLAEPERPSLLHQWAKAQEDLEGFKRDIRRVQPRYAELQYPGIYTAKQIQPVLVSGSALLEYRLGQQRSYLFIITPDTLAAYSLPAAAEIEQAVKTYYHLLSRPSTDGEVLSMGQQLYEMLVRPGQELLKDKSQWIIVPDGWLYYLPFEALIQSDGGSQREQQNWRYLLEAGTISYAPSASVLAWLREQSSDQTSARRLLAVYGEASSAPASSQQPGRASPVARDTEREARAIQQALGERYTDVWLRGRVEDPRLKQTEFNGYRLFHFAIQSTTDERDPWRSGLSLALGSEGVKENFLSAPAIFNLQLNAELVTLSHCRPQLAEPVSGSGLLSLVRSFFYAGTPAVVVSLWNLDGPSTDEFMKTFYQALRAGQSKQAALREAKLKLRQHASYQHPIYWAGFALIGDGEGTVAVPSLAQTVVLASAGLMIIALVMLGLFRFKTRRGS